LMSHPWVGEGVFHASFVDEEFIPSIRPNPIVLKAAGQMGQLLSGSSASSSAKWAVGDQWVKSTEGGYVWKIEPSYFSVGEKKGLSGVIQIEGGQSLRAFCYPLAEDRWQARVGNWFFTVRRVPPKTSQSASPIQKLSSLLTGRVHSVLFREGTWVPAHEPALIVESMGMLVPHALPVDVRIVRWLASAEDEVRA